MASNVTVDFNANIARFTSSIDKATNDLNRFQSNASRVSANIGRVFGNLGSTLGIGLSVAGIGTMIKDVVDIQDHLNDLSKTTSLTVEQLSGLSFAAKQSGTDLDSIAKLINKLAVNMGNNSKEFEKLGITSKDPLEAFAQLADVMKAADDQQQRAVIGTKALSRGWEEAAPLLDEGSQKIRAMIKDGTELSSSTTASAKAADEFNDEITKLSVKFGSFTLDILKPALPMMKTLAEYIGDTGVKARSAANDFGLFTTAFQAIAIVGSDVSFIFTTIGKDIARFAENISLIKKGDFAGSRALGELFKKDAEESRKALDEFQKRILNPQAISSTPSSSFVGPPRPTSGGTGKSGTGGRTSTKKNSRAFDPEGDALFAIEEALRLQQRAALNDDIAKSDQAVADGVKRLNDLLAATPTGQLEKAREEMQFLADALEKGSISEEQFLEAVGMHYGQASDAMEEMSQFAIEAARNMQDAFADFLFDPFSDGISGMLDGFTNMLRRMAAEAAAAQLSNLLFGDMGKTGSIGGLAGDLFKNILGSVPKFATGTDYVPRTGLALVHQGEKIIPASKNNGSSGGIVINFSVSGAVDSRTQMQMATQAGNAVQRAMRRNN